MSNSAAHFLTLDDSPPGSNGTPPSASARLRASKNERDLFVFSVNSLNDDDFVHALADPAASRYAREAIVTAPIREQNIYNYRCSGRHNVTSKEVHSMMKLATRQEIFDFMHSLDDYTFGWLMKQEALLAVAQRDHALLQRYKGLSTTAVIPRHPVSARYASSISVPVFSLDAAV